MSTSSPSRLTSGDIAKEISRRRNARLQLRLTKRPLATLGAFGGAMSSSARQLSSAIIPGPVTMVVSVAVVTSLFLIRQYDTPYSAAIKVSPQSFTA